MAAWAADIADDVRPIFETVVPDDARVREAIELARMFASGDLGAADAVRRRGGDAGGAAKDAPDPAARAAAHAAGQAAAVAHMGAHGLGAAGYAVAAAVLAAEGDHDEMIRREARRHVSTMSTPVTVALRSLPALGENRSGPLGPGRLSSGHVGTAIRTIQELLAAR